MVDVLREIFGDTKLVRGLSMMKKAIISVKT